MGLTRNTQYQFTCHHSIVLTVLLENYHSKLHFVRPFIQNTEINGLCLFFPRVPIQQGSLNMSNIGWSFVKGSVASCATFPQEGVGKPSLIFSSLCAGQETRCWWPIMTTLAKLHLYQQTLRTSALQNEMAGRRNSEWYNLFSRVSE